ncbi:hypothetical protein [Mycobacteroides abscessus]|uniref:hypothetical protein n=1 Tax=Mycobacteroides abscessus TaxID=36809 RepID=UPI001878B96F|nr:hypothetical protein [Mycobacteroides abscessus]
MTIKPRNDDDPLRIVCTDRRGHGGHVGHKRAQLADYWGGDRLTSLMTQASITSPWQHEPDGPMSTISTESRQLRCGLCGRNPKVTDDLIAKFAKVHESKLTGFLDISHLDL